jgi:hypothetical protein
MSAILKEKEMESRRISEVSLKELISAGVFEGRPVTVRQVASVTGRDLETAALALEQQSEKGMLARFRIGSIEYYAAPAVALAGRGPSLIRIITDGVREMVCTLKLACLKRQADRLVL